jgi:2-phospho-L-lactate transferase/gluconeogenesis factor (CofD/UPF0052 family)
MNSHLRHLAEEKKRRDEEGKRSSAGETIHCQLKLTLYPPGDQLRSETSWDGRSQTVHRVLQPHSCLNVSQLQKADLNGIVTAQWRMPTLVCERKQGFERVAPQSRRVVT